MDRLLDGASAITGSVLYIGGAALLALLLLFVVSIVLLGGGAFLMFLCVRSSLKTANA